MTSSSSKFSIPANFERLRRELRAKGALFEDPDFPAVDSSVFRKQRPPTYPFQWMRPHEITALTGEQPHLFVDSTSRFDLKQGELGNCWVVASLASISEHPSMVERVVPKGQTFAPNWYAGCFVFRFWFFGKWMEVIVDDRLPAFNGKLIFIHSHQTNEFWGALVEKAYSKLVGGYENLKSGLIGDALDDLTSGLTESIPLDQPKKRPPDLVTILLKSFARQSLVGAGIKAKTGGVKMLTGNILKSGLVSGHAYTVTDIRRLRLADSQTGAQKSLILIRVRNPWGDGTEWNGAWSDNSPEWQAIPEKERKEIGLVKADDGEFWMDWKDFVENFDSLDICHLPPSLSILSAKRWMCVQYSGEWTRNDTAGGREFLQETHWKNPQYKIRLRDSDEDDNDTCTLLVAVMQEDVRRINFTKPATIIGFFIYEASPKYKVPYPKEFFVYNRSVAKVPNFQKSREVVARFELEPGDYIVVPCTYAADVEAKFLLRIFFENPGSEVDESTTAEDTIDTPDGAPAAPAARTSTKASTSSAKASTSSSGNAVSNGLSPFDSTDKSNEPLKQLFCETAGAQFALDAYQLASILNRTEPTLRKWPLTADAAKSLVALADCDEAFRVTWQECEYIVHYLRAWLRAFVSIDSERKGSIPSLRLREAVAGMGYRVPDSLTRRFMHRFSDSDNRISLSAFISCMAFITKVMTIFNENSKKGVARLTLDEFFRVGLVI